MDVPYGMNANSQGCGQPISVSHDTLSIGQPKHLYHHTIFQTDGQSVYLACLKFVCNRQH